MRDPEVVVKPAQGQVDDLIARLCERVAAGERVLVTVMTKRMAEDLTQYLAELDFRVRYLHSELERQMKAAARRLDFEEAAMLRDRVKELRAAQIYKG